VPADARARCRELCSEWPASKECLLLRRFGPLGEEVLRAAEAGEDVEAAATARGLPADEAHRLLLYLDTTRLHTHDWGPDREYGADERAALAEAGRLNEQAVAYLRAVRWREGLTAAEQALAIREKVLGPEHAWTAVSLNNLGELLRATGDLAGARSCHERALAIKQHVLGPEHPSAATSLNNLGLVLQAAGDFAGARSCYERALAISEEVLGPEHPSAATSLNNLGTLLEDLGDLEGARPILERALAILEKVLGPEHRDTATSLNNFGYLLQRSGDYPGARQYFERALAIDQRALGPEDPSTALDHNNLGTLLHAMGDLAGARPYYERALAVLEQVLGPGHIDTAPSLNNLGLLLQNMGDIAGARLYYERALGIDEMALGAEHPRTILGIENLAALDWADGDLRTARTRLFRAVRARREHFQRNVDAAPQDRQLLALLDSVRRAFDAFVTLYDEEGDGLAVFGQALAWQGTAGWAVRLGREMARAEARAGPEERALLARYREATRERVRLLMTQVPAEQRAERSRSLAELATELEELAAQLTDASPMFRRRLAVLDATPEGACERLRDARATLVDYVRYDRFDPRAKPDAPWEGRYLALVVAPDGCRVTRIELGTAPEVDALVQAYRGAIEATEDCLGGTQPRPARLCPLGRMEAAGATLRARVWDPLVAYLPAGAVRVYVVPDGRLNEVPFGALPLDRGGYLLEERELGHLSAPAELMRFDAAKAGTVVRALTALLVHLADRAGRPEGFVVGDVDHRTAAARSRWDRLDAPGCRAVSLAPPARETTAVLAGSPACGYESTVWARLETEAPAVAQTLCSALAGGAWLATGSGADERSVKRELPGKRVIHVATHGFYSPAETCVRPETLERLRYAMPGGSERPGPPAVDPLTLAGLVLAGANAGGSDPANDGILSGREVADLDLSAAELVVLSACETGRGDVEYSGEGATGLGKAFQIAGARVVVVSQWKVPAEETGTLFRDFYDRLYDPAAPGLGRPDAVTALRAAQLARLRAARQEKYIPASAFLWGAFVVLR